MRTNFFFAAVLALATTNPVLAGGNIDRAATNNSAVTKGNAYGKSAKTNRRVLLQQCASSAPLPGSTSAPANIALWQHRKKSTLPPTILQGFVANSGKNDAIYGGDGVLLPRYKDGFDMSHRIETGLNAPELTTHHRIDGPSSWDFPQ